MTIASQTSRIGYTGDGSTTVFSVPFYFASNSDLVVSVQDLAGTVTTKVLGTDYTLTGATLSAGGSCTFTSAPTAGYLIAITRVPPITQTVSYNNNDPFPAKSHEGALDKATTVDQYLKSLIDRAIIVAPTDNPPMTTLPAASVRALKTLSFDSLGNPTVTTPVSGSVVSSAMIPVTTASTLAIARTNFYSGSALSTFLTTATMQAARVALFDPATLATNEGLTFTANGTGVITVTYGQTGHLWVGNGSFSADDSALLVNRTLTPSNGALNSHGFRDETVATQNVGATFTGTGSGTNLTASAVTGKIVAGDAITGTGVPVNTTISSQTSGTPGGAGVYVTNNVTTSSGAAITATIFSGYASYDCAIQIGGVSTTAMNHVRNFQARGAYTATGTVNEMAGLWVGHTVSGASVAASQVYGAQVTNMTISGGATVTSQIAYHADTLSGATTNYFLFGGSNPSILNGNLYVGGRLSQLSVEHANVQFAGATDQGLLFADTNASAGNGTHITFYRNNVNVGFISSSLTTTSYSTTSDERLKDFTGTYDPQEAIRVIRADPVRRFTWKATGDHAVGWGAQTSHAVSEDLATAGDLDANKKPGDEGFQAWGVDQSRRTPYLWSALSNALDRIDVLEARLKAAGL